MRLQQTSPDSETRLYDSETVRRTLAHAAEIQAQASDAPLTAAQIEALGRELGLSPAAIRRSLAKVTSTMSPVTTARFGVSVASSAYTE